MDSDLSFDPADPVSIRTRSAAASLVAWRTEVTGKDPLAWAGALRAAILDIWESLGLSRSRAQSDLADALSRATRSEDAFLEAAWITLQALSPEDLESLRRTLSEVVS